MPKDPTKNIDRYKVRGGTLNEYEVEQGKTAEKNQKATDMKAADMKAADMKAADTKATDTKPQNSTTQKAKNKTSS
jgi:hypothetical protein